MNEFIEKTNYREKKVASAEIIVTGTKDKPYFEIRYKEVGKEDYSIGYSSYDLNNVFDWKEECFEIVNEIAEEHKLFGNSEQVNGGWIPCSEYVPQDGDWVLCFGKNREGRIKYEVSTYAHEIQCWMCSRIADVVAWQPLPAPYNPKGE